METDLIKSKNLRGGGRYEVLTLSFSESFL